MFEQKIFRAFEKLFVVYRAQLWDISQKYKLSPLMIQFLNYLDYRKQEQKQRNTVSYLSSEFRLTKATVSEAVSVLVRKGYVTKKPVNGDSRFKYLALTKEGEEIVGKIKEVERWFRQLLKEFPDKDKEANYIFLIKLLRILKLRGDLAVLRSCLFCVNFEFNKFPGEKKPHYCRLLNLRLAERDVKVDCSFNQEKEKTLKNQFFRGQRG